MREKKSRYVYLMGYIKSEKIKPYLRKKSYDLKLISTGSFIATALLISF